MWEICDIHIANASSPEAAPPTFTHIPAPIPTNNAPKIDASKGIL